MTHEAGWIISLGAGTVVSFIVSEALHKYVSTLRAEQEEASRIRWMPALVGLLERTLYTLLIGFTVSGAASFIGAWVTIKAVGGWANWSKDQSAYGRSLFSTGLIGSAVSALFGIWGGLVIAGLRAVQKGTG